MIESQKPSFGLWLQTNKLEAHELVELKCEPLGNCHHQSSEGAEEVPLLICLNV